MALIDSHAHLTFPELREQLDAVLARCRRSDIDQIITIGANLADAREAVALAREHPFAVRAAAAFHPHEADSVTERDLRAMAELWSDPSIVALGEMGLDYRYDLADRRSQRSLFARQLELALERPQPLVIHCREAFDDTIPLLLEHGFEARPVVFHCFTGTAEEAARVAQYGWRISFTGIVTFPNANDLQEIARKYPAEQLMIETDAPYLSPTPVRGRHPNEPAHLPYIAQFLANLRGLPYETLAGQTAHNTRKFFSLDS